jgi:hypothetical protein
MSDTGASQEDEPQTPADEEAPQPEDAAAAPSPGDADGTPKPEDATVPGSESEKRARGRVAKQGEDTIGKLAQDLLEHPMVTGALSAVFETRERATRAQEVAMSALNLPSASDIERLTRRLRSVSQRLEGLEDGIDQVADRLDKLGPLTELHARLDTIEATLGRIEASLATKGSKSS